MLKRWVVLCNGKEIGFAFTKWKALKIMNEFKSKAWEGYWFDDQCEPNLRIQILEEEIE